MTDIQNSVRNLTSNAAYRVRLKRRARIELNKLAYRLRKCPIKDRTEAMEEIREHRSLGVGTVQHFLARALVGTAPMPRLPLSFGETSPYFADHPERNRLKWESFDVWSLPRVIGHKEVYASLKPAAQVLCALSDWDFEAFCARVTAKDTPLEKMAALKRKATHTAEQVLTCKVPHWVKLLTHASYRRAFAAYRHLDKERENA